MFKFDLYNEEPLKEEVAQTVEETVVKPIKIDEFINPAVAKREAEVAVAAFETQQADLKTQQTMYTMQASQAEQGKAALELEQLKLKTEEQKRKDRNFLLGVVGVFAFIGVAIYVVKKQQ